MLCRQDVTQCVMQAGHKSMCYAGRKDHRDAQGRPCRWMEEPRAHPASLACLGGRHGTAAWHFETISS